MAQTEMLETALTAEEVDEAIREIWQQSPNRNCRAMRVCPACKTAGYARCGYPSDYSGRCVRCGRRLPQAHIPGM